MREGEIHSSSYTFYKDTTLRELTRFPFMSYSTYDAFQDAFIPLSTWGRIDLPEDTSEYLIIRSTPLKDRDCPKLDRLTAELRRRTRDSERHRMLEASKPADLDIKQSLQLATPPESPVRQGKRRAVEIASEAEFVEGSSTGGEPVARKRRRSGLQSFAIIDLTE